MALILGGYGLYLLPQVLTISGIRGFCLFHSITGIPCPGCGMGRASLLLAKGDVAGALFMHPLSLPFMLVAATAIIWLTADLIRKRETLLPLLKQKVRWPYSFILLMIVLAAWIWNIVKEFILLTK